MLIKLMSYEFRATGRTLGLCYAGVLAAAVLVKLFFMLGQNVWYDYDSYFNGAPFDFPIAETLQGYSVMLYTIMIVAVFVVIFITILQRFYKNLLGGEGYLMHTLPVEPWQLITSKLIMAVDYILIGGAVILLSIFILVIDADFLRELPRALMLIDEEMRGYFGISLAVFIVYCVLLTISTVLYSVTMIYASIMIGHQAPRHKIAAAFGGYFLIGTAINMIQMVLINILASLGWNGYLDWLGDFIANMTVSQIIHGGVIISIVYNAIFTAVFFYITNRLMVRNLNLE